MKTPGLNYLFSGLSTSLHQRSNQERTSDKDIYFKGLFFPGKFPFKLIVFQEILSFELLRLGIVFLPECCFFPLIVLLELPGFTGNIYGIFGRDPRCRIFICIYWKSGSMMELQLILVSSDIDYAGWCAQHFILIYRVQAALQIIIGQNPSPGSFSNLLQCMDSPHFAHDRR